MSKAIKATLLSAFVFPGIGHFYLKKHITGTILAGIALASLYLMISRMAERALLIADKIQSGEVPLDITAITELLSKQPAQLYSITWTLFVLSWLFAVADSYRIGRRQDKK